MIENLPAYIEVIFGMTVLSTLLLFIWTVKSSDIEATRKKARPIMIGLAFWLAAQGALTLKGSYYAEVDDFPPRIILAGILPPFVAIIALFATSRGRLFIDSLPIKNLTYLNTVRIPVEITLFWLFLHNAVPELMTFEGRNFDILAGISAPLVAYFGFGRGKFSRSIVLLWNIICLGLLANIVLNALFSAPSPLQRLAFDQPNIAILYFPFSWLPTFIVPIVLFGHLTSIRTYSKVPGN